MGKFNIVAESPLTTVLAEYKPETRKHTEYQSEADLEKELIDNLRQQGYEYLHIHSAHDLEDNLRREIQSLNNYVFPMKNGVAFLTKTLLVILKA